MLLYRDLGCFFVQACDGEVAEGTAVELISIIQAFIHISVKQFFTSIYFYTNLCTYMCTQLYNYKWLLDVFSWLFRIVAVFPTCFVHVFSSSHDCSNHCQFLKLTVSLLCYLQIYVNTRGNYETSLSPHACL